MYLIPNCPSCGHETHGETCLSAIICEACPEDCGIHICGCHYQKTQVEYPPVSIAGMKQAASLVDWPFKGKVTTLTGARVDVESATFVLNGRKDKDSVLYPANALVQIWETRLREACLHFRYCEYIPDGIPFVIVESYNFESWGLTSKPLRMP